MDALKLAFRLLPYLYLFLALLVLISLVSVVIGIVTLLRESTHHAQDWRELATLMVLVVIAIVLAGIYIFNAMFLLKRRSEEHASFSPWHPASVSVWNHSWRNQSLSFDAPRNKERVFRGTSVIGSRALKRLVLKDLYARGACCGEMGYPGDRHLGAWNFPVPNGSAGQRRLSYLFRISCLG